LKSSAFKAHWDRFFDAADTREGGVSIAPRAMTAASGCALDPFDMMAA
jgi:hypothetical protein